MWGTENFQILEQARDEFVLLAKDPHVAGFDFQMSEVTGKVEPTETSKRPKRLKQAANSLLIISMMFLVAFCVVCCQYVKLTPIDGISIYYSRVLGSLMNALFITLFSLAFEKVAQLLTAWENPRTDTEFEDSLIAKAFLFQFVNNFFCLFYIAFGRSLTLGAPSLGFPMVNQTCQIVKIPCSSETVSDMLAEQCIDGEIEVPSCMSDLSFQLAIILIVNQVGGGILEVAIPTYLAKAKALERDYRIKQVQKRMVLDEDGHEQGHALHATHVGDERLMMPYDSVFRDYTEMAVQWGNVLLFAVVFPLAPLFAMMNNLIEIRADAFKLCRIHRRPEYSTRQDIGNWENVFATVSLLAVITNAALVNFVGSQTANLLERSQEYDDLSSSSRLADPYLWLVTHFLYCFCTFKGDFRSILGKLTLL